MEHLESLRNLAELGLTIVGFSALITLVQQRKKELEHIDKVNLIRFNGMLEQGVVLAFGCYLPVVLVNYIDQGMAFRLCSLLVAITATFYAFIAARRNKRITGKVNIVKNATAIYWSLAAVFVLYNFSNALGLLGVNYSSNYLTSMFVELAFSISLFMRLIYSTVNLPRNNNKE